MNYQKYLGYIAVALLAGAFIPFPYFYFQILRIVVTIAAVVNASAAYHSSNSKWVWAFGLIAVLFNPIAPIFLDRIVWLPLDFIAAVVFVIFLMKKRL